MPLFEDFLKSKGKTDLLNVPRCLSYNDDGENNYIALEDAKAKGFSPIPRQKAWGLEDCQLIFKAFARFHGIGLALWHQKPTELLNAAKHLSETLFAEKFWKWYGRYYVCISHFNFKQLFLSFIHYGTEYFIFI